MSEAFPRVSTSRLAAIDLLRGVAILLVVHQHVTGKFVSLGWRLAHPALVAIPTNGSYGVNLFFVLSGFVLFLPWIQRPTRDDRSEAVRAFYRRRARRILPLYYLSLAVAFPLWVGWSRPEQGAWWHLGMVASFLFQFSALHFVPKFNPVLWSLGVEVSFSLLLPFLALAALRWGVGRVAVIVVVGAAAVRLVGTEWGRSLPITDGIGGRLDDFVVGMAAAWAFASWPSSRRPVVWIAGGLLLFEAACMASNAWAVDQRWGLRAVVVPNLLNASMFATLRGMLAPTLRIGFSPLQRLGRMSYSIYLWHVLVRHLLLGVAGVRSAADLVLYVVVLLGLSTLTYWFIELRLQRTPRSPTAPAS